MSADSMTYDETNQKIVLFFKDSSDNVQGIVGTVSGTTISMGTAVDSTYNNGSNTFACVWTKQGVVALINRDDSSPYYLHYLQATVSGTSLSYAGATTLNSQAVSVDATGVSIAYNSATYNVVPFYVENATKDAQALVVYPSGTVTTTTKNLTNDNYFGIASTTASDTEAVGVNRAGSFNNDQTGLTAGKDYYAKDDGTIIERTTTSTTGAVTEAYSSETALNDPSEKTVVVSDGNGTFLMVYQGSSLYTTIQAGTMSGTTMTWGTAQVFESTDTNGTAVWWDSNRSCFVVCARSTTGNTYVRVKTITVSGQAITIVDSEQTQVFGGSYDQSTMRGGYDSTAQVGFFVNTRGNSPTKTSIIVVSLDGSKQITFGTEVQDNDRIYYPSQFVHDTNGNGNVAVIGARYNSSTTAEVNTQQAYVITISGTTPTIKTPVEIATYTYKYGYSVYDASANKTVCIYGDGSKVYYNVCSMSSGVITSGTETEIATGNITEATQEFAYAGSYDPFTEQIGITYHDSSNYYYLRSGKVSGASITWSTAIQVDPSTVNKHVNVVNANSSDSNTLVLYWVNSDSAYNTWTIGSSGVTSLTVNASQFVGTARSSTDLELAEPPIELVGLSNGAITKGRPVILRTDGDFEEVALSSITNTYTYSKGTETELSVDAGTTVNSVYDANADRFVVTHQNSSFGYAIVVSTSGTTPTVENAVSFCSGQYNGEHAIPVYDSTNNRVAIIYTKGNDNNKGASVVGNVGASTISFGSEVEYNSDTNGGSGGRWAYFDEENGKVVLFVRQFTNNNYPTVYIGTINDTAITWTAGTVIESTAMTGGIGASYSSASKKGLFAWEDNSNTGQAIVGTLSDTTMTFGTKAQFTSQNIQTSWTYTTNGICYDSVADKFIILYQIMTGVDGQGIVATISGTDVSFGTETKLHEEWNNVNTIRQSDLGKIPIIYRDSLNNPYYAEITITGTTPSKSGDARLNSNTTYFTGLSIDTSVGDVKLLATYEDNVNDLASTVIVPNGSVTNENPNLTATNFIGFAQKTVADNEDVKVATTGQSDENQSSLTTASQYYVQNDGTLSTTAGTPSVLGGTALSSTKILIKS
jgi:hypothetical protein